MKTSNLLLFSSIIAALGGLLFGFDTAVISGTTDALQAEYGLSKFWLGFTVAIALIGTIIGAGIVKFPSNSWGRKPTLIVIAILYFVSAIGSAFPWVWYSFLFFRFIGGIGVGGASVVSPLYTAEISPARLRGRLVAITQLNIVIGILAAFFSNYLVSMLIQDNPGVAWRTMFGVEAVPAALFFVLLFFVRESPRWLITKGRNDEARDILAQLGTDTGDVDEEVRVIQHAIEAEEQNGSETFFQKKYRIPIMYAFLLGAFNQLSGINAILYYAPSVFKSAGASEEASMFFPVIIGFVNLIVTMLAMVVIDSFGRRKLLFVGSIGYILSLAVVAGVFFTYGAQFDAVKVASEKLADAKKLEAAADVLTPLNDALQTALSHVPPTAVWIVLGALILFISSHAFGQGAIIWVFIGEIFPNRVRAQGQALGCFTHWVFCAAISWTFPWLLEKTGAGSVFAFYAAMMVLQLLWVIFVMPETKQIPLEEMQKKLGIES